MQGFHEARKRMVEEQLIPRGISDKGVLKAMLEIERHKFIAKERLALAYNDSALPIEEKQTISQPYMVALMTELLELKGEERVLEIGTGSGYQTAVLSKLAAEIYSIERLPCLAESAEEALEAHGCTNIKIRVSDGTLGWEEEAPFDRIIITVAAPKIPQPLQEQVKDSGIIVAPLRDGAGQVLVKAVRNGPILQTRRVCNCIFVPLIGEYAYPEKAN